MEELLELLNELYPGVDFKREKNLITDGIIDSADTVSLISEIEDTFDITVTMKYIRQETFESADAMWAMIEDLR